MIGSRPATVRRIARRPYTLVSANKKIHAAVAPPSLVRRCRGRRPRPYRDRSSPIHGRSAHGLPWQRTEQEGGGELLNLTGSPRSGVRCLRLKERACGGIRASTERRRVLNV